jgi:hypothetical protein
MRRALCVAAAILAIGWPEGAATQGRTGEASCEKTVLEARLSAGDLYTATLTEELVLSLVPELHRQNPPGWTIRVHPADSPDSDYSMVVTPPYRFWNPRYLDTGYGVSAREALERTPRDFAFVASSADYDAARGALDVLLWSGAYTQEEIASANRTMDALKTYPAELSIEDGDVTPPDAIHPSGTIDWIRFRVELCIPLD